MCVGRGEEGAGVSVFLCVRSRARAYYCMCLLVSTPESEFILIIILNSPPALYPL